MTHVTVSCLKLSPPSMQEWFVAWQWGLMCHHITLQHYGLVGSTLLASSVNQNSQWTIKPSRKHHCKARLFITQGADEEALWKTAHLISDKYPSHLVKTCMLIKELRKELLKKDNKLVQRLEESKSEFKSFSCRARPSQRAGEKTSSDNGRQFIWGSSSPEQNFSLEASWHFCCILYTSERFIKPTSFPDNNRHQHYILRSSDSPVVLLSKFAPNEKINARESLSCSCCWSRLQSVQQQGCHARPEVITSWL